MRISFFQCGIQSSSLILEIIEILINIRFNKETNENHEIKDWIQEIVITLSLVGMVL